MPEKTPSKPEQAPQIVAATAKIAIPTATAQQKGLFVVGGKPVYYTKRRVKSATALYRAIILSGRPRGFRRFIGGVKVTITFRFRATAKKRIGQPKVTRPDLDNMAKVVLDAGTKAGVWGDDEQVTTLVVRKRWAAEESFGIRIEPDEPEGA